MVSKVTLKMRKREVLLCCSWLKNENVFFSCEKFQKPQSGNVINQI